LELEEALSNGTCVATEKRSAANTTPTTLHDFSKVFAQVYQQI
jgi:hypothetical protein